ncbi:MAG: 3-hydroxyacyl-ACP dehydratase FabZ [Bdellovibrio sp.]|nr:3-hydroxyacyl-ACP dehydratase FabZ [Bdellovibrio sp.]
MAEYSLNVNQIQSFLPHRSPFLLVDRILEIHPVGDLDAPPPVAEVGTRVVGIKAVTFNEPYFQGHFPGFAIVPGVLLLETMAQVASFSVYPNMVKTHGALSKGFQCILVGVEGARFRKPVVPGDSLRIETLVTKRRATLWVFQCQAFVDGQKVAEADILANLITNSRELS